MWGMRFTGIKGSAISTKKSVSQSLGVTFNVAGMCENHWGQGVTYKRKWIYLHPKLLKDPKQLLPLVTNPRSRN